jgi:Protein of unknown function (DUF5132)
LALGSGWKSAATLVIGGVIGVVLAPTVAPALAQLARPVAKAGIRAGLLLFERGRLAAAELREAMEDITAEVQAEFAEERGLNQTEPPEAAASVDVAHPQSPEIVH